MLQARWHEPARRTPRHRVVAGEPEASVRRLASFNRARFLPGELVSEDESLMSKLELALVEDEVAMVRTQAANAPCEADAFLEWFAALRDDGPGQGDPLFDWLAHSCSITEMTWFLCQEVAGEAGFEDLVALTQLKMPRQAKLELARNYWDEMGQGQASAMHGPMLAHLAEELGIPDSLVDIVWESLALANLMVALAVHRRHAFRSLGALGVIELTAPGRARQVNEGLKRLGITGEARRYYALHATLDIKHSEAWNREIIGPLVCADPALARPIAEGALARLTAGARCFQRYREVLASS